MRTFFAMCGILATFAVLFWAFIVQPAAAEMARDAKYRPVKTGSLAEKRGTTCRVMPNTRGYRCVTR